MPLVPKFASRDHALRCVVKGFDHPRSIYNDTCYSHVGREIKRLNPGDGKVRLWGRKESGNVVHADLVVGNTIHSTLHPENYDRFKYEKVHEIPLSQFKGIHKKFTTRVGNLVEMLVAA